MSDPWKHLENIAFFGAVAAVAIVWIRTYYKRPK